jgi:hypothetical protein
VVDRKWAADKSVQPDLNFFPIFNLQQKIVNSKWKPSHAPKSSKFCMMLDWSIFHNVLNCANFKFPI